MVKVAQKKDAQFFAELLLALERRVDVNRIQIDGIHLWPIARLSLGSKFKQSDPLDDAGLVESKRAEQELPPGQANDGFPRSATERRNLILARRARLEGSVEKAQEVLEDQWARLSDVGPVDFLIFSKIDKYYQSVGGRRYAPILDPVYEDLSRRGRALVVALEPLDLVCVNEPFRVDIEPQMLATAHWPPTTDAAVLEQLQTLNGAVEALAPDFVVAPQQILRRFDRLRRRMPFFRKILEILRPRAVFMSSFTGWLPLIWAARELAIPTVDLQHGGQQIVHYPTTHFGQVPAEGYTFLPDFFWVWGELNRRAISKWLPGGADRHVPIVGGNRNVAKWYRDYDEGRLADSDRDFLQRFSGVNGLVLVTLSYAVDRLLPDLVAEAIMKSPELTWLIRLHPIHRNQTTRDQIMEFLKARGCQNFYIDEPTNVWLQTILSICHHHTTPFSTSGREAIAFGVPTTICHPIGANVFRDEIAAGLYEYVATSEALLESIRKGIQNGCTDPARRREAMETSDESVDSLLRHVLGSPA